MSNAPFRARPIPSLIQGVSQQSAEERRDTQCEAQYDCINSPRLGVVARNGADILARFAGLQLANAFVYELRRGIAEHYLMVLSNGTLRIFDLNTGSLCTVTSTVPSGDNYLASASGVLDVDNFRVQTVGDATFIINKSIVPAMLAGTLSPSRPQEAMVFFEAGNYSTTYSISIYFNGSLYQWSYTTPDNSVSGNAAYITTNQIAATFYRAMTGMAAGGNGYGVGGVVPGSTTGVSAPVTAGSLGFNVLLNGNLLYVERTDGQPFVLDVTDGGGDTQINALQGVVQSFSNLPKSGFPGFTLRVIGSSSGNGSDVSDDYYVTYVGDTATGYWQECPAPNIETTIDPKTMPHTIFCSAVDTFVIQQNTWLPRICGDGVNTALNPGFIGKPLQDIGFFQGRLQLMTDSTIDWSKTSQEFTFFPDTVQTVLADAPISITLAASDTTALLRRSVVVDESLIAWAQLAQFRINSGINPFQADTIQSPESTAYEFNEKANFVRAGTAVYFAYEADLFCTIFQLQYQQGRAVGETEVTAHVQEYIPAGVRRISISTPLKMMFVGTDGASNSLYLYNSLTQGDTLEQSAWNCWNLPDGQIIWHGIYQQLLYVALQRTDGLLLLTVPLNSATVDPGGEYQTRLDLRITEQNLVNTSYDAMANQTSFSWAHALTADEQARVRVAVRNTDATRTRGRLLEIVAVGPNYVVVKGDQRTAQVYLGLAISSSRKESTFYLRTQTGAIPMERLQVKNYKINYQGSGYSRIEIVQGSGQTKKKELFPVPTGSSVPVLGEPPVLTDGALEIRCDSGALELSINVINDSHLPSRWTSAEYQFVGVERPTPMLTPYGGPVQ